MCTFSVWPYVLSPKDRTTLLNRGMQRLLKLQRPIGRQHLPADVQFKATYVSWVGIPGTMLGLANEALGDVCGLKYTNFELYQKRGQRLKVMFMLHPGTVPFESHI